MKDIASIALLSGAHNTWKKQQTENRVSMDGRATRVGLRGEKPPSRNIKHLRRGVSTHKRMLCFRHHDSIQQRRYAWSEHQQNNKESDLHSPRRTTRRHNERQTMGSFADSTAPHLVGVDASAQLDPPAEESLQSVLQGRHAGASADKNHVRDVVDGQGRILEHGGDRVDAPGEEFVVERLELFPRELHGQVGVVKKALHLGPGAQNARAGGGGGGGGERI